MIRTYKYPIQAPLLPNQVVVFGSNTQGRHGKGMAKWCMDHANARYGQATGLQGGKCYAIVTKDLTKTTHPSVSREHIIDQIKVLYGFARVNDGSPNANGRNSPKLQFLVAYGTGPNLNGYTPQEMADMFVEAGPIPNNVLFADVFAPLLQNAWQPISTAPMNGTIILGKWEDDPDPRAREVKWANAGISQGWYTPSDSDYDSWVECTPPSHWQPIN